MKHTILILLALFPIGPLWSASLHVNADKRRFSFGGVIENARLGLDANGKTLWAEDAVSAKWTGGQTGRLALRFAEPAIEWTIDFSQGGDGESALIMSSIRNLSGAAVALGRCRLADAAGPDSALVLGPSPENAVAFVESGWQQTSPVVKLSGMDRPRKSKTLVQIYNQSSRTALHLGFVSYDRISTVHELAWDKVRGVPTLSAYCDFEGFMLPAGATVATEKLRLATGTDPYSELETWANLVSAEYKVQVWPKIPAGGLGWSWVDGFNVERYEDVVLRNARSVRERLPGLDIEYVWVSIGNLEGKQPGNWLRWNSELFPSGPQALIGDLAKKDFKLGFWCGAFWLSPRLKPEVDKFRDALLLKDGKPLAVPHREIGEVYVLDPTHPKTQAFLKDVFTTYRDWGVRYFMIDFLDAISGTTPGNHIADGYYDRSLIPGPQAYRAGVKVIADAAGADTYLLPSTGPTLLNVGLVAANRVGTDYGEGRALDGPGKGFYPGTFVINRAEYWTSHRAATNALAGNYFTHRKLYLADSGNVMTIDKPIPVPDAQITTTIFGINGSPLMLGDDISRMSEDRLAMIKQVFPRLPEAARPLDLFDKPEPGWPETFHLKVKRDWDEWDLVAVFNYRSKPLDQDIAFERLGGDPAASYVVWDYWNERYLGMHRNAIHISVPAQSVRLLRIARERAHPWIASTDMHVRQGQAEIAAAEWDPAAGRLTIEATRPAGYSGRVFVRAPQGLAMKNPKGFYIAKDANDSSLIIRCDFDFTSA
ncbi:MAG TPA: hypothetical protein PLZ95_13155, partial [Bryobacteraceae bacterium]|nr:hypothetical protein [Bryobacteraceae bacterium]